MDYYQGYQQEQMTPRQAENYMPVVDQPVAYQHYDGPQPQQQPWTPIQPISNNAHTNGLGLDSDLTAGLSYLCFWLTGLLVLLFEKRSRLARFHAMQSLLFFGGVNILYIVFISIMVHHTPFIFGFAIFAFVLMNVVGTVAWIVGMVGAFSGKYVKLPFVGDIAERYVHKDITLK